MPSDIGPARRSGCRRSRPQSAVLWWAGGRIRRTGSDFEAVLQW